MKKDLLSLGMRLYVIDLVHITGLFLDGKNVWQRMGKQHLTLQYQYVLFPSHCHSNMEVDGLPHCVEKVCIWPHCKQPNWSGLVARQVLLVLLT